MKRLMLIASALSAAATLAACNKTETAAPAKTPPATPMANEPTTAPADKGGMGDSPMAGEKMAKGTGTVTAVDASAGTITIDHAAIPEAGWPAMTMAFKVDPAKVKDVKTGQKISFDLKLKDGAGEVTSLTPLP